jgi:hypothetical protein
MTHTFLPECLSKCQGLHHTFSKICTKFDAVSLSDPSQNHIRPDTQLQTKGCKKISSSIELREILYTDSQGMLVLSSTVVSRYYNCCTDWQYQSRKLWIPPCMFHVSHRCVRWTVQNSLSISETFNFLVIGMYTLWHVPCCCL